MLADIPEWQIAYIHPMDHERAGYPQNVGCVVGAELLVFREHGNPFALQETRSAASSKAAAFDGSGTT